MFFIEIQQFFNKFMLKHTSQRFSVEYFENTGILISFTLRVVINITENSYSGDLKK
jgi:hypothetical protein